MAAEHGVMLQMEKPVKIILVRHGEPDLPFWRNVKASEFQQWIKFYNSAGIKKENLPPKEVCEVVSDCSTVVCSDLPRSIESAKALGVTTVNYIDPIFREMGLPYVDWNFPKLSPTIWATLFRLLWFAGFSRNSESLKSGKLRATGAAEKLKDFAHEHGSVTFVGHGMINRFLANELLSSGWRGPLNPGKRYWEFGVYEYINA
ncbi:histidine phosphatase family protein [Methylomicrobium agile]|uniref:histidine phosphatase family protein n=1 Tax=Methylomicrobium agile TaxID=39774 RepID=UPI00068D2BE4|nr:histidine phosphatase family protein [Methylomicrobium agile]